ncbi:hypothetical protein F2Q69_00008745 [Brassica cretica]|uniref:Uncharacterized protein n=1 Tax=Brassica cretica TaxID=69181 RepID=A0A8S9P2Z6_BRACR|nr:hypothetical protein F2Q69_00008745 [Brassica cretica]
MDSCQLTEPGPPEPPDPPSPPVRTSNRSFSPVKALILCKSHIINGVSFLDRSVFSKRLSISAFHLLLLTSVSESFMSPDLNMKVSQISVLCLWSSLAFHFLSDFGPKKLFLVWVPSMLVNLVVASCTGCSALITTSCFIHLPKIQVVSLRFSNLFTGVVLIVVEWSPGLSLILVRSFTALDGVIFDVSIPWVLLVDIYYPLSSSMECVPLPISSSTLSGFVSGSKTFKIRDTSDIEVLIKGSSI